VFVSDDVDAEESLDRVQYIVSNQISRGVRDFGFDLSIIIVMVTDYDIVIKNTSQVLYYVQ